MKKALICLALSAMCAPIFALEAQNTNSSATTSTKKAAKTTNTNTAAKKRPPIFRANKDQITQAQTILKQRSFYDGAATGKLDPATRVGLKKYQKAESLKVTGTLNKITLEKMGIELTDKQKEM